MSSKHTVAPKKRDALLMEFCLTGRSRISMCRHSGKPIEGVLIGRAVLPLLLDRLYGYSLPGCKHSTFGKRLNTLLTNGVINAEEYVVIRDAIGNSSLEMNPSLIREVEKAVNLLVELCKRQAVVRSPKPIETNVLTGWRRMLHSAASLVAIGRAGQ